VGVQEETKSASTKESERPSRVSRGRLSQERAQRAPAWSTRSGSVALLLLAVLAIVAAAHWPVLSSRALCFDDHDFLTDHPLVRHPSWHSAGRFFGEVLELSTVPGYYIPLSMVSPMLDAANGATPENLAPIHRTSLVLHLLTTAQARP